MKKIILGLGTIGAIAAPVAAVVSCGSTSDKLSGNGYFKTSYKDLVANIKSKLSSKIFVDTDGTTMGADASGYISGIRPGTSLKDSDEIAVAYTHITFKDYLANFEVIQAWNNARMEKFTKDLPKEGNKAPKYTMLITLIDNVAIMSNTNLEIAFFTKTQDDGTTLNKAAAQALFDKLKKLV